MALFQVDFVSQALKRSVAINAIIPAEPDLGGAKREGKPFKTLYLLHGYSGDNWDWLIKANSRELSKLNDLAIIMPSGENSFYLDIERTGRLYSTFIGRELVEFTRSVFPLSSRREDTFIAGLSMGGYGALYNGLKHHDAFSHIIALSSANLAEIALRIDGGSAPMGVSRGYIEDLIGMDINKVRESDFNLEVLAKRVFDGGVNIPELYIACGYNDNLVFDNRRLSAYLSAIGYKHVYEEGAGTHEWAFWDAFLKRAVARLPVDHIERPVSPYWIDAREDSPNPVQL